MSGRLQKAVQPDSTDAGNIPSFRRMGYGFKVNYDNNGDFAHFIAFRAADDPASLNYVPEDQILVNQSKEVKVLILSMYNEDMYIERFKRSGCRGYIFKTASLQEVTLAIHTVYAGETYFPASKKNNIHKDDFFLKKLRLSTRELEVMRLVKRGINHQANS